MDITPAEWNFNWDASCYIFPISVVFDHTSYENYPRIIKGSRFILRTNHPINRRKT